MEQAETELMSFAASEPESSAPGPEPWKILVVDDEEEIHKVTKLALESFTVLGRPLQIFDAYSGRESVEIMAREADIALVLMDVVMETEHAGLDAVQRIRHQLGNRFVRIVLRTGQPGQAPELEVVRKFDINDYKEKTELTTTKLYTVLQTGLSLYRELIAMERNRLGLEQVIEASASIFKTHSLVQFQRGVLEQITALLYAKRDALVIGASGVAASLTDGGLRVSAGTGSYQASEGALADAVLDAEAMAHVQRAIASRSFEVGERQFAAYFSTRLHSEHVVYLSSDTNFSPADARLIELFCRNVAIAFENLTLNQELLDSQRQLIILLSTGIEERSKLLRNHVRRVSEYAKLLGRLLGLSEEEVECLGVAAAMHDLGKIGIPDAILDKPGRLDDTEREIMETHVLRGQRMLEGQKGHLLKTAELVVGGHHERWDGGGYPRGLAGTGTHLFARITGLADVFDALSSRRVYKEPWTPERIAEYLREERGRQFEPKLVDLFLDHYPDFLAIHDRLPGEERE
jgi:response regulator RpfG family c-di-GMP phosphodiesterase